MCSKVIVQKLKICHQFPLCNSIYVLFWTACIQRVQHVMCHTVKYAETLHQQAFLKPHFLQCLFRHFSVSPCSLGPVLAMIHLTRQHLMRAFRVKRGLCHLPLSFCRPVPGSSPLASPSRLPSPNLPSSWERKTMTKSLFLRTQLIQSCKMCVCVKLNSTQHEYSKW